MQREMFIIYPIQLDSTRTISGGRKYPLVICIPRPSISEMVQALQKLSIEYQEDLTKRHPRDHFTYGRLSINKKYGKKYAVEGMLKTINSERSRLKHTNEAPIEKEPRTGPSPNNPLNLVARRKKKGKKTSKPA